jgi:DDE superfamily endonuclease
VIPPDASAGFVAAMEDVLETYQKPRDPDRPLVCLDKASKQLIIETRTPIPAKPGQPVRHDYEYERNGVANLFMIFAPLEGWRHVKVTGRHAAVDYAQALKELSDTHFPDAEKIVLVQDNLSTHTRAGLMHHIGVGVGQREGCADAPRWADRAELSMIAETGPEIFTVLWL